MVNNNRQQIIALIEKAERKVQIAVSWLTDEVLIKKLCEVSKKLKVELLLSCDPLNVWRYSLIRELQSNGALVLKTGSNAPGLKNFMHAKFMIIDDTIAYGGSFNFTEGANHNFENFKQYAYNEVNSLLFDFRTWWNNAKDYKIDFENPDDLKKMLVQNFQAQDEFRQKILNQYNSEQKCVTNILDTERDLIIKAEIQKEKIREVVNDMRSNVVKVDPSGSLDSKPSGISSKPHRFFGGQLKTKFNGTKKSTSYSTAMNQKREIEKKFTFIKCRIENDILICRGKFKTLEKEYDVRIEYKSGNFPQVYILNPSIKVNDEIHVYKEGSLCLFYPGDLRWKDNTSIAEYTIPWIFEWLFYYEIYQLTGVWEGEFVPHGKINNIIEN